MAILRTNGFVQLRRGLIEHLVNQLMTPTEFSVYVLLIIHADPSTGVWRGCAETISQTYRIPTRTCRDIFNRLEKHQYIRRFQVPGKRGIYPILINRFECTDGAMRGQRLNAYKSSSYTDLVYEECRESAGTVPGECRDGAGTVPVYREEENKRTDNKRKKPSRAKAASDLRHTPFRGAIETYWDHRNTSSLPWDGRDAKALSQLLAASPDLTLEQFQQFLQFRAKSTVAHGDRVYLWIARIHSYTQPLNGFNRPEGSDGKPSPAIERQNSTVNNLREIFDASGDYPTRQDNREDRPFLSKPSIEQGNPERVSGRLQGPSHALRNRGC